MSPRVVGRGRRRSHSPGSPPTQSRRGAGQAISTAGRVTGTVDTRAPEESPRKRGSDCAQAGLGRVARRIGVHGDHGDLQRDRELAPPPKTTCGLKSSRSAFATPPTPWKLSNWNRPGSARRRSTRCPGGSGGAPCCRSSVFIASTASTSSAGTNFMPCRGSGISPKGWPDSPRGTHERAPPRRYAGAQALGIRPARCPHGRDGLDGRLARSISGRQELDRSSCCRMRHATTRPAPGFTSLHSARRPAARRANSSASPGTWRRRLPLRPAPRGELRLVLPQALLNAPAADLYVATELLHIAGTRVIGSRGHGPRRLRRR